MSDHSYYEELAALAAGGFLSDQEAMELQRHTAACVECLTAEEEFAELVRFGLPLTVSPVREFLDKLQTQPDEGARTRFLQRARLEGFGLSTDTAKPTQHHRLKLGLSVSAATVLAVVIFAVVFPNLHVYYRATSPQPPLPQTQQQFDQLRRENSALLAKLSHLNESLATQQREIRNLRAQLGSTAEGARDVPGNGESKEKSERSFSHSVQLLDELENKDKLLAEARDEVTRINQLRADDEASIVAQQARITELSDQLRVAGATLDLERQLASAGRDIRELIVARQLHVIDVRDTDPTGRPSKAFGRVFLAEGKSLTFYAFDLSEDRVANAKHRFEVWGVQEARKSPARSLGFLYADDKAQRRWALKLDDPEILKEIDSVFVTLEPANGAKTPSGHPLLYAYLGEANHS